MREHEVRSNPCLMPICRATQNIMQGQKVVHQLIGETGDKELEKGNMKRKKINEKIADWMGQVVRWLSFVCLALVLLLNLFYTSSVGDQEMVSITGSSWQWIPAAAALLVLLVFWCRVADRIPEKKLFAGLTVFYVIAGCYFIFNITPTIRDDAKSVYDAAAAMADGDFSSLDAGNYLYVYPYQIGIVTYDRIVRLLGESVKFLEALNLAQIIGINYFSYRLADLFFGGNRKINHLTILLSFAFLPQLFFLMFKYGLIPGFFFMIGCFYFLMRWLRDQRPLFAAVSVAFGAVAACIKMNYLIGIIAVAAIVIVEAVRRKRWRYGILAAVYLLASVGAGKGLQLACELESGIKMPQGMNTFFWVVMGTDIDNEVRGPGWYNSIGWKVMGEHDFDIEESNQEASRLMDENIRKILADPGKAASFFERKTISLWCDPIYQSLWSGLSKYEVDSGSVQKDFLRSLYYNEAPEQACEVFLKGLLVILTAGAVIFLLLHWKQYPGLMYAPLYFLGGFLFHSFWEAKSQYVYTYIFILIPLCAFEIYCLSEWFRQFVAVRRKRRRAAAKVRRKKGAADDKRKNTL